MQIPTICLFNIDGNMVRCNADEKAKWESVGFVLSEAPAPKPVKPAVDEKAKKKGS